MHSAWDSNIGEGPAKAFAGARRCPDKLLRQQKFSRRRIRTVGFESERARLRQQVETRERGQAEKCCDGDISSA